MSKVVKLRNGEHTIDHINMWLESQESDNTRIRYRSSVRDFIEWKHKGLNMVHVKPDHFNHIRYIDMEKFKNHMRRKYSVSTTNNTMTSLYSLFKYLNKIQDESGEYIYNLDVDRLRVKNLKDTTREEYGVIEWEETDRWIDYLLTLPERANPKGKAMFIKLARLTGLRKQALADLTFRDIRRERGHHVIHSTLKGKQHKIHISDEIANEILELKKTNDPNERVLKMSTKTIDRTFAQILEHFQVPEEDNIVIHSLRALCGYEAYLASGNDPIAAKKLLGHEDFNTTMRYINKQKPVDDSPTLYMGQRFDGEEIRGMNEEDWQEVYNGLSRSAKYEILHAMKKLGHLQ